MDRSIPLRQILQAGVGLGSLSMAAVLAERGGPYDPPMAIAGGLAGLACMAHAALGNRATRPRPVADGLDRVLLHWDEDNAFTLRDLLNGGVAIFGRTGSGKTSSSGKALAHAIVSLPGSGGLIIAAKPGGRASSPLPVAPTTCSSSRPSIRCVSTSSTTRCNKAAAIRATSPRR
jgi:hypothetical protein